jgi:ubiquinone/menaquinone biosynthesis C-methylase UbiE
MFKKLTMVIGFGAGYVLGAKAGTQRYEQIVEKARELAGMPAVQNATAQVQDTASSLAGKAKETVNEKVASDSSAGGDAVVDLGTGTGATTRSTAAAGAAPSGTAPTRP